jgi:hypothetical protein
MPSGKVSKGNRYIYFDIEKFRLLFYKAIKGTLDDIRVQIRDDIKSNIKNITFKTNKVRLAGGRITSDAMRKKSLLNSVVTGIVKDKTNGVYATTISTMKKNFKESFIGIYYEHGTGERWDGTRVRLGSDIHEATSCNLKRTSRAIVSRSKYIKYVGSAVPGQWYDLGGNLRITGAKRAGVRDANFIKYIGEDTRAHHWHKRAFRNLNTKIRNGLIKQLRRPDINLSSCIVMKKVIRLGGD